MSFVVRLLRGGADFSKDYLLIEQVGSYCSGTYMGVGQRVYGIASLSRGVEELWLVELEGVPETSNIVSMRRAIVGGPRRRGKG